MKIFTVAEMVAAEKAADAAGHSYVQMMELAGRRTAEALAASGEVDGRSILILVGPGNNGGDGLVAGRYLAEMGANVAFYLFKERDPAQDDNFARARQMALPIFLAAADSDWAELRRLTRAADLILDGLLGTGVARPISGQLADLLREVHASLVNRTSLSAEQPGKDGWPTGWPRMVAIDCPSGLNCDNGALDPLALQADLTVTFAGPKWGHFLFPGAAACGQLVVADIGIDPALPQVSGVPVSLATKPAMRRLLPSRPLDGHKGRFGSAYIAAGSDYYRGAVILAGRAAYRVGAGLVALVTPTAVRPTAAAHLPEATYPPLPDKKRLGVKAAKALSQRLNQISALLVGPGLDQADDFLLTLLPALGGAAPPLVIDADGLNILARQPNWAALLPPETILTPHPGEMARLMGVPLAEVKAANRISLAREMAQAWGHIVLLKGAYTVIAAPDGRTTILPFANPLLGAAGSGDVLAGAIAGLLAQGMAQFEAAVLGGYLHGLAGDLAGQPVGLLAGELADLLPQAWQLTANS